MSRRYLSSSFPTFTYPEVQEHLQSQFQPGAYDPTLSADNSEDLQESLVNNSKSSENTLWNQQEEARSRYLDAEADYLYSSSSDWTFIPDTELLGNTTPSSVISPLTPTNPTPVEQETPEPDVPIPSPSQDNDSSLEYRETLVCNTCNKHYTHKYQLK